MVQYQCDRKEQLVLVIKVKKERLEQLVELVVQVIKDLQEKKVIREHHRQSQVIRVKKEK